VTDNGFGIWNYTFPVTGGATPDSDGDCDGTKSKKSTSSFKLSKGLSACRGFGVIAGFRCIIAMEDIRADFSCLLPTLFIDPYLLVSLCKDEVTSTTIFKLRMR
jgi:hypothetical protein